MTVRVVIAACLAAAAFLPRAAHAYETEWLTPETNPVNRFNLVILGDGYTGDEPAQAKLTADAREYVAHILATPPFKELQGLFTAKLVHVVSNQTGASNGTAMEIRDTALKANYTGCPMTNRCLVVDNAAALLMAAQHFPEYTYILVIVNDAQYGGTAGSSVSVTSVSADGRDTVTHELAHLIGNLADEYEWSYQGYPSCPESTDCPEPNVTLRTSRDQIKWSQWIDAAMPIPSTGNLLGVGLFEGARYQMNGVFRPTFDRCKMRTHVPQFCPVCMEALMMGILERVTLIDTTVPARGFFRVSACSQTSLLAKAIPIPSAGTSDNLSYRWTIDGIVRPEVGESMTLPPGALTPGSHSVVATVTYGSPLIRRGSTSALTDLASWSVFVDACP